MNVAPHRSPSSGLDVAQEVSDLDQSATNIQVKKHREYLSLAGSANVQVSDF
jgi:hypothetical protein